MLAAAFIATGCSAVSSQGDASNNAAPSAEQGPQLTADQVEAAHLERLNSWIARQDKVRPPAPSVARPSQFSEGRCIAADADAYKCSYTYFEGGKKRATTANFARNSNGTWSIR
jgi:hypothetical protein